MADLTTVAAVKAFAGVTSAGDDAAIGGIVSGVSAFLHGIVGHTFDATVVVDERHPAPASGSVVLLRPAQSVTAVREGTLTLAASGWRHVPGSRVIERVLAGEPIDWSGRVSVDYTAVSAVPADLELAAREAAAWVIKESGLASGASRLGLTAQANAESGSADYFIRRLEELPIVRSAIRRYARFV